MVADLNLLPSWHYVYVLDQGPPIRPVFVDVDILGFGYRRLFS
jgi:hypothetical protein